MTYANTTNLKGNELKVTKEKAMSQRDAIIYAFKTIKIDFTASQMWEILYKDNGNTPLTSVRRAMSYLSRDGYLIKTERTQKGIYGKKEHFYKLN